MRDNMYPFAPYALDFFLISKHFAWFHFKHSHDFEQHTYV